MIKFQTLFLSFLILFASSCEKNNKDKLVVGSSIDGIISLDPAEAFEISSLEYIDNTYDTLVVNDPKNPENIIGSVAEKWVFSRDKNLITFTIKPNIKFASGNALTARDVAFSLQRAIVLQKGPSEIIGQFGFTPQNVFERIRAIDDYTLEFRMDGPYAETFVLRCLTSSVGSIVDEKQVITHQADGDMGNRWLKTNYAGSGPFRLKLWKPKEILMLDANKEYFKGSPKIENLVFQHVSDPSSGLLMLEKGDIDILKGIDLTAEQVEKPRTSVRIERVSQGVTRYMVLNQKIKELMIPEVQQAIRYLIDYRGIVNSQLRGEAFVHQTFLPIGFMGAINENPYDYNAEKARALLKKVGLEDKLCFTLDISNSEQGQALQASFSKGGITLKINLGDTKQVITRVRERSYEIAVASWIPDYFDPHGNAASFAFNGDNSDQSSSKTIMWRASWFSPELNKLTERAKRESNQEVRQRLYHDLQRKLLNSPIINMFQFDRVLLIRNTVHEIDFISGSNKIFYANAQKS